AILRRRRDGAPVALAGLEVDPVLRTARAGERELTLTPTEFRLLHLLMARADARADGRAPARERNGDRGAQRGHPHQPPAPRARALGPRTPHRDGHRLRLPLLGLKAVRDSQDGVVGAAPLGERARRGIAA